MRLSKAGCRDFFVATWVEAAAIAPLLGNDASLSVLHGVRAEDMPLALSLPARPVLNSGAQIRLWRDAGGAACDVMVDTGMNRLGIGSAEATGGLLDGMLIHTMMSHLASADEDGPQNQAQLASFRSLISQFPKARHSLANSAGICLGADYHFGLTRPGLALYGGVPRAEAAGHIRQVVTPEAQIIQFHDLPAGATVGYNATWTAARATRIATIHIGYADGYLRCFSGKGSARAGDWTLPVVGRVSMDLTAIAIPTDCDLMEGDWVALEYDLPHNASLSGLSQYELLTGLGARFDRVWS